MRARTALAVLLLASMCHAKAAAQMGASAIAGAQIVAFAARADFGAVLCGYAHWSDRTWYVDSLPLVANAPPCPRGNAVMGLLPPEAAVDDPRGHTALYDAILAAHPELDIVCGVITPPNGVAWCRARRPGPET